MQIQVHVDIHLTIDVHYLIVISIVEIAQSRCLSVKSKQAIIIHILKQCVVYLFIYFFFVAVVVVGVVIFNISAILGVSSKETAY